MTLRDIPKARLKRAPCHFPRKPSRLSSYAFFDISTVHLVADVISHVAVFPSPLIDPIRFSHVSASLSSLSALPHNEAQVLLPLKFRGHRSRIWKLFSRIDQALVLTDSVKGRLSCAVF